MVVFVLALHHNCIGKILKDVSLTLIVKLVTYSDFAISLEMVRLLELYLILVQSPSNLKQLLQVGLHPLFVLSRRNLCLHD